MQTSMHTTSHRNMQTQNAHTARVHAHRDTHYKLWVHAWSLQPRYSTSVSCSFINSSNGSCVHRKPHRPSFTMQCTNSWSVSQIEYSCISPTVLYMTTKLAAELFLIRWKAQERSAAVRQSQRENLPKLSKLSVLVMFISEQKRRGLNKGGDNYCQLGKRKDRVVSYGLKINSM